MPRPVPHVSCSAAEREIRRWNWAMIGARRTRMAAMLVRADHTSSRVITARLSLGRPSGIPAACHHPLALRTTTAPTHAMCPGPVVPTTGYTMTSVVRDQLPHPDGTSQCGAATGSRRELSPLEKRHCHCTAATSSVQWRARAGARTSERGTQPLGRHGTSSRNKRHAPRARVASLWVQTGPLGATTGPERSRSTSVGRALH